MQERWWSGAGRRALVVVGLAVALVLASAAVPTARAQEPADAATDTEEALQVEELARRLLPTSAPPPTASVRLLPGTLPDGMPLAIPMPPGSRLLGSALHTVGGQTSSVTVLLDAIGSAPDLKAWYIAELAAIGIVLALPRQLRHQSLSDNH
jgi:hypothetical protein